MRHGGGDKAAEAPGWSGLPVVGETLALARGLASLAFVRERVARFGATFASPVLGARATFATDHAGVAACLGAGDETLSAEKGYRSLAVAARLLGDDNVLLAAEPAAQRAAVAAALDGVAEPRLVEAACRHVEAALGAAAAAQGAVPLYDALRDAAATALSEALLGVREGDPLARRVATLGHAHYLGFASVPLQLKLPGMESGLSKAVAAKKELLDVFRALAVEERARLAASSAPRAPFVAELVRHSLSDDQVAGNLLVLANPLVHKCTASLATSALKELAVAPVNRNACRAEAEAALAGGAELEPGALRELRHVGASVTEAARLFPAFFGGVRVALQDIELPSGHAVRRGCPLWYISQTANRDASVYAEPDAFRPERWLEGDTPAHWAFGAGAHQCAGRGLAEQFSRLVVALATARYDVELEPKQRLEYKWVPVARPRDRLLARVKRR